jgi:hypothetical protein
MQNEFYIYLMLTYSGNADVDLVMDATLFSLGALLYPLRSCMAAN